MSKFSDHLANKSELFGSATSSSSSSRTPSTRNGVSRAARPAKSDYKPAQPKCFLSPDQQQKKEMEADEWREKAKAAMKKVKSF